MSNMRIDYPHKLGDEEARARIKALEIGRAHV